jgi:hypothetical protein
MVEGMIFVNSEYDAVKILKALVVALSVTLWHLAERAAPQRTV